MCPTRRDFLSLAGLAAASAMLAACSPVRELAGGDSQPTAPWPRPDDPAWRALSRLTFGPTLRELARAAEIGPDAWIEEQLAPETITDTEAEFRLRRLDTLRMDSSLLFDVREENVRRELQQAAILRAVYSRRQLYEVIVDFWSDHFNISTLKSGAPWLKTIDDREVVRPHALGQFRDLLWASMHSPAMLVYLDNQENRKGYPNENYAREVMELHTLGVDGGYTQRDVQEVARCLTGWTVGGSRRGFRFEPELHDDDAKLVLGRDIPAGGGERDGERVFEILVAHPSTARFISRKLARRLVADDPPPKLVAAAAETFAQTGGDIKAVLRTILYSEEFRAAPPKIKRPFHYVAGALRQLHAETDAGRPLLSAMSSMGQRLFERPTPDGYPDYASAWSSGMLARWQFTLGLVTGNLGGTTADLNVLAEASGVETIADALDRFGTLLLGAPLPREAVQKLAGLLGEDPDKCDLRTVVAVLLASPQYQWR